MGMKSGSTVTRGIAQRGLPFRVGRGGARKGAGRKPKGEVALLRHETRAKVARHQPLHVTVKLQKGLPSLRCQEVRKVLLQAFAAGKDRFGFVLNHFVILKDHLHFVVEAVDRVALSRGMQGLLIRVARALNRHWRRKGRVFGDRYHDRALKTPKEVRHVLRYVFGNARKHFEQGKGPKVEDPIDLFSSAPWFDGFVESVTVRGLERYARPTAPASTWLLRTGWRRHGLLSIHERPRVV